MRQCRAAQIFPPIIGMGHLFTAGGKIVDGDGVRDLYVGSLAHLTSDTFPEIFDYLALGHLHVPQKVAGSDFRRYSGSPIPMNFGEAQQQKTVVLVEFKGKIPSVKEVSVPCFQALESVKGDWESISKRLDELKIEQSSAWLEIVYTGNDLTGDLRQRLEEEVGGSALQILRVKNNRLINQMVLRMTHEESLEDLNEEEVFQRSMEVHQIPQDQQGELLEAFREILTSVREQDLRVE